MSAHNISIIFPLPLQNLFHCSLRILGACSFPAPVTQINAKQWKVLFFVLNALNCVNECLLHIPTTNGTLASFIVKLWPLQCAAFVFLPLIRTKVKKTVENYRTALHLLLIIINMPSTNVHNFNVLFFKTKQFFL